MKSTIFTALCCLACSGLLWALVNPVQHSAAQGGVRKATPTPSRPEPVKTRPRPNRPSKSELSLPTPPKRTAPNIEMVNLPGGTFSMGSPDNEAGHSNDESPQHRVTISGFAIGKYEVTQAQWKAVMGTNPSNFNGDDLPVESVSWNDAKEFCRMLSQMTSKAYRLPTEAEWEYAARAGSPGPYAGELDAIAWYGKNSGGKTHPVGQKKPNAFGLFDMHGNAWEWCEDVWHDNYNGAPTDGSAWLSGGESGRRVVRGGSWSVNDAFARDSEAVARAAVRYGDLSDTLSTAVGFRLVLPARTP